jgi:glycosyltransferase involved in cell wall biosynthesis
MARPYPIHLAVHSLGVARATPEGIETRSAFGPYVEALADAVECLTLVAYDPPAEPTETEDLTEFVMRPARGNIEFLSLGPKGTWRDYPARARRVQHVVGKASSHWDVLLFRLVNRRAHLVFRANECPRVVSIIGGSVLDLVTKVKMPLRQRLPRFVHALRAEAQHRRILAASGIAFANGEELVRRYRRAAPHINLLRSSARRAHQAYRAVDRLDRDDAKFLIAGQIKRDKGVFQALDAFERIHSVVLPEARLHVAGIGPDLEKMRSQVRVRGLDSAVTFHGWIPSGDALFALYREMDVLLCLSEVDFLPRVVWEAMAHSVLVVATQVGSLPHAFRDREEILFVDSADSESVELAVREVLERPDLRLKIIVSAFERAKEATLECVVGDLLEAVVRRWPELARGLHTAEPSR